MSGICYLVCSLYNCLLWCWLRQNIKIQQHKCRDNRGEQKNIEYLSTKHDCVPMSDMAELSLIGGSIVLYNIVNIIHMTWEHFHLSISPCIQCSTVKLNTNQSARNENAKNIFFLLSIFFAFCYFDFKNGFWITSYFRMYRVTIDHKELQNILVSRRFSFDSDIFPWHTTSQLVKTLITDPREATTNFRF